MAQLDRIALNAEADIIKNEVTDNANTALRVGQMLNDLADSQSNLIDDPSGVTPQVYEAVVSFDGNDSTGAVGGLPFLTPTAASVALRAYVGTSRLMTIKAGIYVGEDLLFADGIISCDDDVTIQSGDVKAMFDNFSGVYNGIDFQVLGNPNIEKIGSQQIFRFGFLESNRLNSFTLYAGDITNDVADTLWANNVIFEANNFNQSQLTINANILVFNLNEGSGGLSFKCYDNSDDALIKGSFDINIKRHITDTETIQIRSLATEKSNFNINLNYYQGLGTGGIQLRGGNTFMRFNTIKSIFTDSKLLIFDSGGGGDIKLSGLFEKDGLDDLVYIQLGSVSQLDLGDCVLNDLGNGEVINAGDAQTVNLSGTLTMITTADPKIGANITLNQISEPDVVPIAGAGIAIDYTDPHKPIISVI